MLMTDALARLCPDVALPYARYPGALVLSLIVLCYIAFI